MRVAVRYFASVREALGGGEQVDVPAGASVGAVRDTLIARGAAHAAVLGRGRAVRSALDHALCDETAVVTEGAEVGFFPPVTGG